MAGIGKFLFDRFKNKEVEFYCGVDREWINYSDSSVVNGTIIRAIPIDYDDDSKIITFITINREDIFYVVENMVSMFWKPGFKILENTVTTHHTGNHIFNKKNKDFI